MVKITNMNITVSSRTIFSLKCSLKLEINSNCLAPDILKSSAGYMQAPKTNKGQYR